MTRKTAAPSFDVALSDFARAQSTYRHNKRGLDPVDDALDALLLTPSPSVAAFGEKLRILNAEYGIYAQPRHLAALFADAALLAWFLL